ncbi:hypothetical protein WICPIJ_002131 [Wickerhamomyces pijperi]|uniref:Uncharacterized protein n=1 Tax=Wickerhamomyces pijperi TaxID=599730 RepID=A0A9P8TQ40_WICPI|nr:hypothetical protein WICPIJ_002131 [Wickerhamomyces pijperi]
MLKFLRRSLWSSPLSPSLDTVVSSKKPVLLVFEEVGEAVDVEVFMVFESPACCSGLMFKAEKNFNNSSLNSKEFCDLKVYGDQLDRIRDQVRGDQILQECKWVPLVQAVSVSQADHQVVALEHRVDGSVDFEIGETNARDHRMLDDLQKLRLVALLDGQRCEVCNDSITEALVGERCEENGLELRCL